MHHATHLQGGPVGGGVCGKCRDFSDHGLVTCARQQAPRQTSFRKHIKQVELHQQQSISIPCNVCIYTLERGGNRGVLSVSQGVACCNTPVLITMPRPSPFIARLLMKTMLRASAGMSCFLSTDAGTKSDSPVRLEHSTWHQHGNKCVKGCQHDTL